MPAYAVAENIHGLISNIVHSKGNQRGLKFSPFREPEGSLQQRSPFLYLRRLFSIYVKYPGKDYLTTITHLESFRKSGHGGRKERR